MLHDEKFQWLTDGVAMPPLDFGVVEAWIEEVAKAHGRIVGTLSYIFCNDPKILEVNRQFHRH